MFRIDKEALQYIKPRSGSVVIDLKLNPNTGGWCPPQNVTGRYVPKLSIREPNSTEQLEYIVYEQDGLKIYYPTKLKVKDGFSGIRIKLRKLLFFKWLEIEGAELKWVGIINRSRGRSQTKPSPASINAPINNDLFYLHLPFALGNPGLLVQAGRLFQNVHYK